MRLPAQHFDYIPFKINRRDLVDTTVPTDAGYIFCGGKTRRDFDTFIAAVAPLPYPVKIVTTSNDDIAQHGYLSLSVRSRSTSKRCGSTAGGRPSSSCWPGRGSSCNR